VAGARAVVRTRRYGAPGIEILRVQDRPLILACKAKFVPPLDQDELRHRWVAEFRATQITRGTPDIYPWFEARADAAISPDGAEGTFRLRLELPETVPAPLSEWLIRIRRADRKKAELEFILPTEAIFLEEYPVS
jgi:hypothetical protein